MRRLIILIILLTSTPLFTWSQNDLKDHLQTVKGINMIDSVNLTDLDVGSLPTMDSTLLVRHKFISFEKESEFGTSNYSQADCRILSYSEGKEFNLLILIHYTSLAGDGNPKLQLSTISEIGQIIDKKEFSLVYPHDPEYVPKQFLIFDKPSRFKFLTKEIKREFKGDSYITISNQTTSVIIDIEKGKLKTQANSGCNVIHKP